MNSYTEFKCKIECDDLIHRQGNTHNAGLETFAFGANGVVSWKELRYRVKTGVIRSAGSG